MALAIFLQNQDLAMFLSSSTSKKYYSLDDGSQVDEIGDNFSQISFKPTATELVSITDFLKSLPLAGVAQFFLNRDFVKIWNFHGFRKIILNPIPAQLLNLSFYTNSDFRVKGTAKDNVGKKVFFKWDGNKISVFVAAAIAVVSTLNAPTTIPNAPTSIVEFGTRKLFDSFTRFPGSDLNPSAFQSSQLRLLYETVIDIKTYMSTISSDPDVVANFTDYFIDRLQSNETNRGKILDLLIDMQQTEPDLYDQQIYDLVSQDEFDPNNHILVEKSWLEINMDWMLEMDYVRPVSKLLFRGVTERKNVKDYKKLKVLVARRDNKSRNLFVHLINAMSTNVRNNHDKYTSFLDNVFIKNDENQTQFIQMNEKYTLSHYINSSLSNSPYDPVKLLAPLSYYTDILFSVTSNTGQAYVNTGVTLLKSLTSYDALSLVGGAAALATAPVIAPIVATGAIVTAGGFAAKSLILHGSVNIVTNMLNEMVNDDAIWTNVKKGAITSAIKNSAWLIEFPEFLRDDIMIDAIAGALASYNANRGTTPFNIKAAQNMMSMALYDISYTDESGFFFFFTILMKKSPLMGKMLSWLEGIINITQRLLSNYFIVGFMLMKLRKLVFYAGLFQHKCASDVRGIRRRLDLPYAGLRTVCQFLFSITDHDLFFALELRDKKDRKDEKLLTIVGLLLTDMNYHSADPLSYTKAAEPKRNTDLCPNLKDSYPENIDLFISKFVDLPAITMIEQSSEGDKWPGSVVKYENTKLPPYIILKHVARISKTKVTLNEYVEIGKIPYSAMAFILSDKSVWTKQIAIDENDMELVAWYKFDADDRVRKKQAFFPIFDDKCLYALYGRVAPLQRLSCEDVFQEVVKLTIDRCKQQKEKFKEFAKQLIKTNEKTEHAMLHPLCSITAYVLAKFASPVDPAKIKKLRTDVWKHCEKQIAAILLKLQSEDTESIDPTEEQLWLLNQEDVMQAIAELENTTITLVSIDGHIVCKPKSISNAKIALGYIAPSLYWADAHFLPFSNGSITQNFEALEMKMREKDEKNAFTKLFSPLKGWPFGWFSAS